MKEKKVWQYSFPSRQGEGWAEIILREDGFFAAVSDYGNYSNLWSSHGCDDFRKFFFRVDVDYIVRKLCPKMQVNSKSSFDAIRLYVQEERRRNRMTKKEAQEIWEHLSKFHVRDWELFMADEDTALFFPEPFHFQKMEYNTDAVMFVERVVRDRLVPVIRRQLDVEQPKEVHDGLVSI